jgi:Uncharacterized protein conserved in bacteria
MTTRSIFIVMALLVAIAAGCSHAQDEIKTFPMSSVTVQPELSVRLERNLSRLQDEIYQPPHVFEDLNWPGDFIGRTILGLTLDEEALHTETSLLKLLIESLPSKLNEKGYLGPVYAPVINEQQLSGHGWLLRGLCEYSRRTGDKSVLPVIKSVAENLFAAGNGRYSDYPIAPGERTTEGGEASGSIAGRNGDWLLSTDIGCIFIGMAGLIDAYELVPDKSIKATIDELIARFLEVDLVGIKAQTHATLSALRGLIKYSRITGSETLMEEAARRWHTYVSEGMTCCYGNLNWFGRPDSWTEPCAIVDSYIVAFELWKATLDPSCRDMAEMIAVNAIGHAQRLNGGFGCDNCPSEDNPFLTIVVPEAHWCCTMRGAEGLFRLAESSWAVKGDALYVPFYRNSVLSADGLSVTEVTEYPEKGTVSLTIGCNDRGIRSIMLPDLSWADFTQVTMNGETIVPEQVDGMFKVTSDFAEGDRIEVGFEMPLRSDFWNGSRRFYRGPVMLGLETESVVAEADLDVDALRPVGNLMTKMESDHMQVLFQ